MKLMVFYIFFLFHAAVFAQDCDGLKNNEVIRLDAEGKSLEKFKTQDQDGVGTCYSNATSLLLHGVLPNNPDLSYLHMAAIYKKTELSKKRNEYSGDKPFEVYASYDDKNTKVINGESDLQKWNLGIDSGNVCGVVEQIKELQKKEKKAVVCSREGMNLEKIIGTSGDRTNRQFKSILESSLYMNIYQSTFFDTNNKEYKKISKKYEAFKNSFTSILNKKREQIKNSICLKPSVENVDHYLRNVVLGAGDLTNCFKMPPLGGLFCKIAPLLLQTPKLINESTLKSDGINKAWLERVQLKINAYKGEFSGEVLSKMFSDSLVEGLMPKSEQNDFNKKLIKNTMFGTTTAEHLNELAEEFNDTRKQGVSKKCLERNMTGYLLSKKFTDDWKEDPTLCANESLMKQGEQVLSSYQKLGLENIENALNFLIDNAGFDFDETMVALYATDCDDGRKILIPDNVECEASDVNQNNKREIEKKLLTKILNNQPVIISMCAEILKSPKSEYGSGTCGRHAMGVIGIECKNGKFNYLIKNSWGNYTEAKNPEIKNEEGKGAYWFDEKTFFDSVYKIENIK